MGGLPTHLSAVLVLTMLLMFALVGGRLLVYGVPALESQRQRALQQQVTEVEVPADGLRLDRYPGALGQAIGHLIQNAVVPASRA